MADQIKVTGMVLSVMPVGEYDRRIVLLTREMGKIHGFARGVRRVGSALMAATQPFVFGEFTVVEGKNAYTITGANVSNYFNELREDVKAACYGCYFLELADYYGRENADDTQMLILLYQTLRALAKNAIPFRLIRAIYEFRLISINGEGAQCFECVCCHKETKLVGFSSKRKGMVCKACRSLSVSYSRPISETAVYTLQYIVSTQIGKLYAFKLSEEVMSEIIYIVNDYVRTSIDRRFNSLDVLMLMED